MLVRLTGSFFDTYPRHDRLISINKRHTGKTNKEFNMRHDWNSLLSDDGNSLLSGDGNSLPSGDGNSLPSGDGNSLPSSDHRLLFRVIAVEA